MTRVLPIFFIGFCLASHAEQELVDVNSDNTVAKNLAPKPRIVPPPPALGVALQKPDPMVAAQLPNLPPGIGFIITAVDKDGPAAAADLQVHDVIWKLGDQLLVNESQMFALLGMYKAGNEVVLSGFRQGKPRQFKVELGKPETRQRLAGLLPSSGNPIMGEEKGITQFVNSTDKFARTKGVDGNAEIRKSGDKYLLCITDNKNNKVYDGEYPANGSFEGVPKEWKFKVVALKRALDRSLNGELPVARRPRPSVVPPPVTHSQSVAP